MTVKWEVPLNVRGNANAQYAVYPCGACGALVTAAHTPRHEDWHEQLDNEIANAAGVPGVPGEAVLLSAERDVMPELIDRIVEVVEHAIASAQYGHGA